MGYSSAVVVTATKISSAGSDISTLPTTPTGTHGNKILQDGRSWLEVNNAGAVPLTVTLNANVTIDGTALGNKSITVAAGKRYIIDLKNPAYTQSDGYVWVTCDVTASITIAAYSNN